MAINPPRDKPPRQFTKEEQEYLEREEQRFSPENRARARRAGRLVRIVRLASPRTASAGGGGGSNIVLTSNVNPSIIGTIVTFTARMPPGTTGTISLPWRS